MVLVTNILTELHKLKSCLVLATADGTCGCIVLTHTNTQANKASHLVSVILMHISSVCLSVTDGDGSQRRKPR